MELKNFKDQIIAIGKANGNVDIGVATDMFLNNVQDAFATEDVEHYAGAEDVDFKALHPHREELEKQKAQFITDWRRELKYPGM